MYEKTILRNTGWLPSPSEIRRELRGKNLACFCSLDQPWCHADVLLRVANSTLYVEGGGE